MMEFQILEFQRFRFTVIKWACFLMGGLMGREGGMCFRFELSPSVY